MTNPLSYSKGSAMAGLSSIPIASTFLILSSTLALLAPTSTANENNILLTGDVLGTDDELSNSAATFVMQNDCNMVLYNKKSGFQSASRNKGINCSLTLSDRGQLLIRSSNGTTVWTSPVPKSKRGKYAAVLRPDGQVAIYGPSVWSTPDFGFMAVPGSDAELKAIPMVRNVLFSDQILYNDAQLVVRDYTYTMRDDCNLVLVKASLGDIWNSGTQGKGLHCFARLDHRGQLAVEDDRYKALWTNMAVSKEGDYVLALQINGQVVVYGPVVWSTSAS